MRPRVLVVAADIDLRARIARGLQSFGLAIELASDDERALRLAAEHNFLAAIVGIGSGPVKLPTMLALRDTVSQMIVLGGRPEEIARLQSTLPGIETLIFNKSTASGARSSRRNGSAAPSGAPPSTAPAPSPHPPEPRSQPDRGRDSPNVLPLPGSLSTQTRPPWASTISRVM
jgi:hypothetical protein